jgi:hypothetical protein
MTIAARIEIWSAKGQPRRPKVKEGLKQVEGRINIEQNLPVDATLCQGERV